MTDTSKMLDDMHNLICRAVRNSKSLGEMDLLTQISFKIECACLVKYPNNNFRSEEFRHNLDCAIKDSSSYKAQWTQWRTN